MVKFIFVVFFVWLLVMMTIQAIRQASGKQLISWLKVGSIVGIGGIITSVILFLVVQIF